MVERSQIAKRIEVLIEDRGTNPRAVALAAGLNHTAVRDIIKGKIRNPGSETLAKIAAQLEVSVEHLITGAAGGEAPTKARNTGRVVHVPRFRIQLSAGPGNDIFDEVVDGTIPFAPDFFERKLGRPDASGLFVMDVKGDSMAPVIPGGSIVLVDTRDRTPNGSIMAFRDGGEAFIKRLTKTPEGIEARAENPALRDSVQVHRPADDQEFQIFGRVCWVAHGL